MEMKIKTKVKAEINNGKKATFRKLETKNVIKCKILKWINKVNLKLMSSNF